MRIAGFKTISEGQRKYPESKRPLEAWLRDAKDAKWSKPKDIKTRYPSTSFIQNDRVIFNVKGNKFRMITEVNYERQAIRIIWFGTHRDYNRINASKVTP